MSESVDLALKFFDQWTAGNILAAERLLNKQGKSAGAMVLLHDGLRNLSTRYGRVMGRKVLVSLPRLGPPEIHTTGLRFLEKAQKDEEYLTWLKDNLTEPYQVVIILVEFERQSLQCMIVVVDGTIAQCVMGDEPNASPPVASS